MSSTYRPITAKLPTTKYAGVSFPNHFQLSPLGNFPLSAVRFYMPIISAHHLSAQFLSSTEILQAERGHGISWGELSHETEMMAGLISLQLIKVINI